jgi:predicted ester cyclase
MSTTFAEENKVIVRRLIEEAWSKGNLAILDEIVATDAVDHNPAPGQAPSAEGLKQLIAMVRGAFPDWNYTIEDMVTEQDKIAFRWTAQGTHQGNFLEPV